MKFRFDFVTNSSSSSFIINKNKLTEEQINLIRNHKYEAKQRELEYALDDNWYIEENDEFISGSTCIDNFDFEEYLELCGIPDEIIYWSSHYFDVDKFDENKKIEERKRLEESQRKFMEKYFNSYDLYQQFKDMLKKIREMKGEEK